MKLTPWQKDIVLENKKLSPMLTRITRVDESLLQLIVDRIRACAPVKKIVLFGSHAYGTPRQESDLDLLIVMESNLPRHKRSVPIYRALAGLLIPKDVLVYTPEEVEAWSDVPQAVVTTAMRKGRTLYEKNQG